MTQNVALIAGATGQIGRSLSEHFQDQPGWELIGLSRNPKTDGSHPFIGVDLLDLNDCKAKLGGLSKVTHLIYSARYDHAGGKPESPTINSAMLSNLLDAVQAAAPDLRHIHLVHGTKYYGHSRGHRPIPYREDAAREPIELFYYAQQDFLQQRQRGHAWTWSISRPHSFCDLKIDEPRSITLLVAVYATLLREMGLPLVFPGSLKSYTAKTQCTWLPLLARAIAWMIATPACVNQAYNVVNDDARTWEQLWTVIAKYFGMTPGEPESVPVSAFIADKSLLWQALTAKHGLRKTDLHAVVQWAYGDYAFSPEWDVVSDMSKARGDGFTEKINTVKMWLDSFDFYREQKLIP